MKCLALSLALALLMPTARADDTAPSVTSVQELLTVMESRKLVEGTIDQADEVMGASMQQALAGRELNDAQRAILDDLRTRTAAVLRDAMQWEALEPRFIEIYRSSFTQGEIDGLMTAGVSKDFS